MSRSNDAMVGLEPEKPAIRLRDTLMAFGTWFAADALAGLAIMAAAVAVMTRSGTRSPEEIVKLLPGDFTFVVTSLTVSGLVALSVIWKFARRRQPKPFGAFFAAVPLRALGWALLGGVIVVTIELALESGIKFGLGIALPVSEMEETINPKSWTQFAVALVALAGFVPLVEEILFRGYLFGWLRRVMPLWIAIVISAAVFAAAHGLYVARGGFSGWFGTGEVFAIGILLAWWAGRTNSLRPGYVAHFTINALSFCLGWFLPGVYP